LALPFVWHCHLPVSFGSVFWLRHLSTVIRHSFGSADLAVSFGSLVWQHHRCSAFCGIMGSAAWPGHWVVLIGTAIGWWVVIWQCYLAIVVWLHCLAPSFGCLQASKVSAIVIWLHCLVPSFGSVPASEVLAIVRMKMLSWLRLRGFCAVNRELYGWYCLIVDHPLNWWFKWGWFLTRCGGHCPVVVDGSMDGAGSGLCSIACGGGIIAGSSSIQMTIRYAVQWP